MEKEVGMMVDCSKCIHGKKPSLFDERTIIVCHFNSGGGVVVDKEYWTDPCPEYKEIPKHIQKWRKRLI